MKPPAAKNRSLDLALHFACCLLIFWEEWPMHANQFFSVLEGTSQPEGTCNSLPDWERDLCNLCEELGWLSQRDCTISGRSRWLLPRIAQFLGRAAVLARLHSFSKEPYLTALCNFVAQQSAQLIFIISRLSRSAGLDCAIFPRNIVWLHCAISEPNNLHNKFAQFLEGRLVHLHNYEIFWGRCLDKS